MEERQQAVGRIYSPRSSFDARATHPLPEEGLLGGARRTSSEQGLDGLDALACTHTGTFGKEAFSTHDLQEQEQRWRDAIRRAREKTDNDRRLQAEIQDQKKRMQAAQAQHAREVEALRRRQLQEEPPARVAGEQRPAAEEEKEEDLRASGSGVGSTDHDSAGQRRNSAGQSSGRPESGSRDGGSLPPQVDLLREHCLELEEEQRELENTQRECELVFERCLRREPDSQNVPPPERKFGGIVRRAAAANGDGSEGVPDVARSPVAGGCSDRAPDPISPGGPGSAFFPTDSPARARTGHSPGSTGQDRGSTGFSDSGRSEAGQIVRRSLDRTPDEGRLPLACSPISPAAALAPSTLSPRRASLGSPLLQAAVDLGYDVTDLGVSPSSPDAAPSFSTPEAAPLEWRASFGSPLLSAAADLGGICKVLRAGERHASPLRASDLLSTQASGPFLSGEWSAGGRSRGQRFWTPQSAGSPFSPRLASGSEGGDSSSHFAQQAKQRPRTFCTENGAGSLAAPGSCAVEIDPCESQMQKSLATPSTFADEAERDLSLVSDEPLQLGATVFVRDQAPDEWMPGIVTSAQPLLVRLVGMETAFPWRWVRRGSPQLEMDDSRSLSPSQGGALLPPRASRKEEQYV